MYEVSQQTSHEHAQFLHMAGTLKGKCGLHHHLYTVGHLVAGLMGYLSHHPIGLRYCSHQLALHCFKCRFFYFWVLEMCSTWTAQFTSMYWIFTSGHQPYIHITVNIAYLLLPTNGPPISGLVICWHRNKKKKKVSLTVYTTVYRLKSEQK